MQVESGDALEEVQPIAIALDLDRRRRSVWLRGGPQAEAILDRRPNPDSSERANPPNLCCGGMVLSP